MRCTLATVALAALAVANPVPQAVTSAISPEGSAPAGCESSYDGSFQIQVIRAASKRDLTKRQDGALIITLQDGVMMDADGRTGYIAANNQFQFDGPPQAGAIYTAGWSVCSNGSLALGDDATFYQCLSGTFYNLYDESTGAQCSPVYIDIVPGGSAAPTPTAGGATQLTDGQVTASAVTQITDGQPQAPTAVVTQITDGQPQAPTAVVTQITDGQPQAPTGVVTQITDGQPQAPTGVVTQITDGQPQAPTGVVTQITDGQPQAPTGVVTQITDGQPQAPTGVVTQITDGQPQAPTGVVTQITDGQPQAPTGVVTQITDGQPQAPTGVVTQISDGQVQAPTITPGCSEYVDGQPQCSAASTGIIPSYGANNTIAQPTVSVTPATGAAPANNFGNSIFGLIAGVIAVAVL